jgi:predicted ATPase
MPSIRTPDQRLRVFVSSTLQEVAAERKAAREAISRLRLAPVMFELGARPHPARDLYRAYLEQSHVFIGIYWERYGWIAPGETISGLEDEYRLAEDKPRLIYIKSPAPDRDPRLAELIAEIKTAASYKYFSDPAELGDLIENDLALLLTERFDAPPQQPLAAAAAPSNLPSVPGGFVGRQRELRDVLGRLAEARMLTLTGAGGTGKTRLAIEAANALRGEFEDRVYFVDLSTLRDADAALTAIAQAVGVSEASDDGALRDLERHIGARRMLLLLDNLEQVTDAAPAIAGLLQACPQLRCLITSREALHVRGEHIVPVAPLSLPAPERRAPSVADLAESEAVQLFVARARAVDPGFELNGENAAAVAEACVRLDGLPLAIELAAARLTVFTPESLLERLGDRMRFLAGGPRDLPARQQTLHDAIDWSYRLLDPSEQRLFQALSLFSGVTLDALAAVLAELREQHRVDVTAEDGMSSLLGKSLVRRAGVERGVARFAMLSTIREFAAARLDEDASFASAVRAAHARYFADLIQRRWQAMRSAGEAAAWDEVEPDIENVQLAWRYWLARRDLEALGKFTEGLWAFYDAHGWLHAMIELSTELLDVLSVPAAAPDRLRDQIVLCTNLARVLFALKGYTPEVEAAYVRAKALCERGADVSSSYPVLRGLAVFYMYRAQFDEAAALGRQLLELGERHDDDAARVEGHLVLGASLAMGTGADVRRGLEHLDRALADGASAPLSPHGYRLGNNPGVVCRSVSGLVSWMLGHPEQARARADDAIALARRLNHPQSLAYALFHAGLLATWLRDAARAREHSEAVLAVAAQYDFPLWAAVSTCLRGAALSAMGSPQEGVQLVELGMQAYGGLHAPLVFAPMLLFLHAQACHAAGRTVEAMTLVDEALLSGAQGSARVLACEFLCLKGDLLLALSPDDTAEAEALYLDALGTAAAAEAWMLHLRAATRLGRLWRDQGRYDDARALLREACGHFTEDASVADVREASALLETVPER